jgi:hypothetical protein
VAARYNQQSSKIKARPMNSNDENKRESNAAANIRDKARKKEKQDGGTASRLLCARKDGGTLLASASDDKGER